MSDVLVTKADFDVAAEYKRICEAAPHAGAVVFFVGLVRDFYKSTAQAEGSLSTVEGSLKQAEGSLKQAEGSLEKAEGSLEHAEGSLSTAEGSIDYLHLEHYPGMTEKLCQEIVDEARERFPFDQARVVHRVGKIFPAEQIVFVAVASRHRDNAFQAAQFIMDYLKTRATLWKKEVGDQGEQWLGLKDKDSSALDRWNSNES